MNDCRPDAYGYQLQSGDRYGGVGCAAYALAAGLNFDSCGAIVVSGARVRALTNEPVPDPQSPGLHHGQLRDVAAKFGVRLELLSGAPWDEVDDAQRTGHGVLLALNYRSVRTSPFSGQRSFSGNHEVLVMPGWFTFDPLADGRMSAGARVYRGPGVYPESLLRQAAGDMVLTNGSRLGLGRAVAAILPHAHPLTLPDTSTAPVVVSSAPASKEKNVAITAAYAGHTFRMAKGQPIFRYPGGPKVTVMSKAGAVTYVGKAGTGWVGVRVTTGALYADHVGRPTVLYVPAGAGTLV